MAERSGGRRGVSKLPVSFKTFQQRSAAAWRRWRWSGRREGEAATRRKLSQHGFASLICWPYAECGGAVSECGVRVKSVDAGGGVSLASSPVGTLSGARPDVHTSPLRLPFSPAVGFFCKLPCLSWDSAGPPQPRNERLSCSRASARPRWRLAYSSSSCRALDACSCTDALSPLSRLAVAATRVAVATVDGSGEGHQERGN
jgi:hypothetical protein